MRLTNCLPLACLALALPVSADRLVTTDGRVLEVKKARETEEGHYRLVFENGELLCTKDHVASVEIEGDMSDYIPKNDDERDKLEQGYVRYEGKWMSKPAYEAELNRRTDEARARTGELAAHSEFHNAWETETKHFIVKSNTSPELLEYYAELLEAYYSLMDDRIGIKPTPSMKRTKMTVNIYKSHEDFMRANPDKSPSVLGYFWSFNNTLNFFHDYAEPERSDWVALHECTHLLTYLIDQDYLPQIWFNEAVADYFGSSTITRDKRGRIEIEPGLMQIDRVLTVQQAIREKKDISLADLFLISRDDFHGFQYAHAWSFVYFLCSDDKTRKTFERFFKDLYTLDLNAKAETLNAGFNDKTGTRKRYSPEDIRDGLLKKLKVKDIEAFDKEWKDFIAAIEIDAPKARFKRAFNTVRQFNQDEFQTAWEDIQAALEANVDDTRVHYARGLLQLFHKSSFKGAKSDFEKAIEVDPLNASFHFALAQVHSGTFRMGGRMGDDDEWKLDVPAENVEAAKREFGLATELAPENDVYRTLNEEFLKAYARFHDK